MAFGSALVGAMSQAEAAKMRWAEMVADQAVREHQMKRQAEQDAIAQQNEDWNRQYKEKQYQAEVGRDKTNAERYKQADDDRKMDNYRQQMQLGVPFGVASKELPPDKVPILFQAINDQLAALKPMESVELPGWGTPPAHPAALNMQVPGVVSPNEVNAFTSPGFEMKKAEAEAKRQVAEERQARLLDTQSWRERVATQKLANDKTRLDLAQKLGDLQVDINTGRLKMQPLEMDILTKRSQLMSKDLNERNGAKAWGAKMDPYLREELHRTDGEYTNLRELEEKTAAQVRALGTEISVPLPPGADANAVARHKQSQLMYNDLVDPNNPYSLPRIIADKQKIVEYRKKLIDVSDRLPHKTEVNPSGKPVGGAKTPGGMTSAEAQLRAKNGIR